MAIRRSKIFFSLGLVLSFWTMFIFSFNHAGEVLVEKITIKEGTPVILSLEKSVDSSQANVGDLVDFIVTRDVKVNDTIVIRVGTHARGEVTSVEGSGAVGKPGKISVAVKNVKAVDGTDVPLRARIDREGKSKQTTALLVGIILCIIGLFVIKGEHGNIPAGSEVKAFIDYDVEINIQ
jgi:hypothetical protein